MDTPGATTTSWLPSHRAVPAPPRPSRDQHTDKGAQNLTHPTAPSQSSPTGSCSAGPSRCSQQTWGLQDSLGSKEKKEKVKQAEKATAAPSKSNSIWQLGLEKFIILQNFNSGEVDGERGGKAAWKFRNPFRFSPQTQTRLGKKEQHNTLLMTFPLNPHSKPPLCVPTLLAAQQALLLFFSFPPSPPLPPF